MTVFVEEGHMKRDLEEAGRIEKGGKKDLVEGTRLGHVWPWYQAGVCMGHKVSLVGS